MKREEIWTDELYDTVTNRMDLGVMILNNKAKIIFANKFIINLYGSSVIGSSCFDLFKFKPGDCPCRKVMHHKKAFRGEISGVTAKTKDKYFEIYVVPVFDKKKKVQNLILNVTDITSKRLLREDLMQRIEFEKRINGISRRFIQATADKIDDEINNALKIIGEFSNADRSYVFEFIEDFHRNTHEWCRKGIKHYIHELQRVPNKNLPWVMKHFRKFNHVYFYDVYNLPKYASAEKKLFKSQGIKSILAIPIVRENKLAGILGFDFVRDKKELKGEDVNLLKIVGDIIAGAVEKKEREDRLKKRTEELEKFFNLTVGRELEMIKMKKKIAKIEKNKRSK